MDALEAGTNGWRKIVSQQRIVTKTRVRIWNRLSKQFQLVHDLFIGRWRMKNRSNVRCNDWAKQLIIGPISESSPGILFSCLFPGLYRCTNCFRIEANLSSLSTFLSNKIGARNLPWRKCVVKFSPRAWYATLLRYSLETIFRMILKLESCSRANGNGMSVTKGWGGGGGTDATELDGQSEFQHRKGRRE